MQITCQHCHTRLTIPDHKVPENKDAALKCPKCKGRVPVYQESPVQKAEVSADPGAFTSFQDRQTALICIESDTIKKKIQPLLRQMGFNIELARDTRTALERMEYRIYNLVLIDESFDGHEGFQSIVGWLNNMDMSIRRRTCLLLISTKYGTNDHMAALHTSVNNIIREEDLVHIDAFLLKVIAEHKQLYTVYSESLKLAGKA